MLVSVSSNCIGCGACATVNPEVFEIYNSCAIVNPNRIDDNEERCLDAAFNCPVNAISVRES